MSDCPSPYTALPDYADVKYVDGKLKVASGVLANCKDPRIKKNWLRTIDLLLDQRSALLALEKKEVPS